MGRKCIIRHTTECSNAKCSATFRVLVLRHMGRGFSKDSISSISSTGGNICKRIAHFNIKYIQNQNPPATHKLKMKKVAQKAERRIAVADKEITIDQLPLPKLQLGTHCNHSMTLNPV